MAIQNLTCTVDQAKKLRELGVTAPSTWVANLSKDGGRLFGYCYQHNIGEYRDAKDGRKVVKVDANQLLPVYTLGELMRMLDTETYVMRTGNYFSEIARWGWTDEGRREAYGNYDSPERAAAELLIYQLREGYITPEECNKALEGPQDA